jgi:DNA-binding protein Fis
MNQERNLLLIRLELIADDYDLTQYILQRVEKTGHKYLKDLSAIELLDLYDSVLCKIYQ